MRCTTVLIVLIVFAGAASAQDAGKPQAEPKSVTVPITLDHNRVIIDVYLPLPDGSTKRVRGWVDNGDTDLILSERLAKMIGLTLICAGQVCVTPTPLPEILIGGMKVPLSNVRLSIRQRPQNAESVAFAGMSAEIKLPSSVLRNYDVLIDFPDREFSIGLPGSLKFNGVKSKMLIDASTGFIQIPSKSENKNYNLGLDVGSSISFLSQELFDKLSTAHADWPHMTGAVGPANMGEAGEDEAKWRLMRVDRLQYGPLYLTNVGVVNFPKAKLKRLENRGGVPTVGLLGSEALLNYRVGLDYAHSTVYLDLGSTFKFPDFDVVGLILRPEDDTRFTIVGLADFEGKPSVPDVEPGDHLVAVDGIPVPDSTMGQVWSLLEGSPGQERKLTVERNGKQFVIAAKVQHFLGEADENPSKKN